MTRRVIAGLVGLAVASLAVTLFVTGDSGEEPRSTGASTNVTSLGPGSVPGAETHAVADRIVNAAGVVNTGRYSAISRRSTTDHPYGPLTGGGSFAGFARRTDLIRKARAAVQVEVVSISNPHFNSADGGFWVPQQGEAQAVLQDIHVRVVDRWGDLLNLPEEFDLVVFGGQVQVTLTAEQTRAVELGTADTDEQGRGQLGQAGTYVMGGAPDVELKVGERPLLFIARGGIGWQGGERQGLRVLGGFQGKFGLSGAQATNDRRPEWTAPAAVVRTEVSSQLGRDA